MTGKRRRPGGKTNGQKRSAGRRRQAPGAGVGSGAREAKREDLAREIGAQPGPRLVEWEGGPPSNPGQADPGGGGAPAQPAERWHDERSEVPALSQIGVELTVGALRLFRTVVTAPVRVALAFLRQREA